MELAIIIVLILLNGVFAMSELAIVSSRRARLQARADKGDSGAQSALALLDRPERFLSTVQIGITMIGILTGVFGGSTIAIAIADLIRDRVPTLASYAETIGGATVVLLVTYLSLVLGELVPKRIALQNPERIAQMVAQPMTLLSRVVSPFVAILSASTALVVRIIGLESSNDPPVTEFEVISMMEQGTQGGVFETEEHEMVQGVLELDLTRVREIITPRPDIVWLNHDEAQETLMQKLMDGPYALYPVCEGDIENVIGIVQAKHILLQMLNTGTIDLVAIMREPLFIPGTVKVLDVLRQFKNTGEHMAIVMDEYGGVLGLVTINDVIEEVIGDVDQGDPQMSRRDSGGWLIDGNFPIDDLVEHFTDFSIPSDESGDYQSLAGFTMARMGRIPVAGDHFDWQGYRFEIMDMDGNRIDKVLLTTITESEA